MVTIQIFSTIVFLVAVASAAEFQCPSYNHGDRSISDPPCNCWDLEGGRSMIQCWGKNTTQEVINKFFSDLRELNTPAEDGWLKIPYDFEMIDSDMSQLDLTPFLKTEFRSMRIGIHDKLKRIGGPLKATKDQLASIRVQNLDIWNNFGLKDDSGLQYMVQFFDPKILKSLYLSFNALKRSSRSMTEFITGMSALSELTSFGESGNYVGQLMGGLFRKNTKLQYLNLNGARVTELGRDSFTMDEPTNPSNQSMLYIDLSENALTDSKVSPLAFKNLKRTASIAFSKNRFEFVSQAKFEPFLNLNVKNEMYFYDTPTFVCDSRMKWLKEKKSTLENRVRGVDCSNDKGKTIFTTTKV